MFYPCGLLWMGKLACNGGPFYPYTLPVATCTEHRHVIHRLNFNPAFTRSASPGYRGFNLGDRQLWRYVHSGLSTAKVAGLSPELTASWVWSVSIGVGVSGLFLSWKYRAPIITAWSTPAAAFLVVALATTPYAEAIGAYMISAAAFVLLGLSGYFEKLIRLIPPGIAAGLLGGILLQFGIGAFAGMSIDPLLVGLLIAAYLVLKRFGARYAVVGILVLGLVFLLSQGR